MRGGGEGGEGEGGEGEGGEGEGEGGETNVHTRRNNTSLPPFKKEKKEKTRNSHIHSILSNPSPSFLTEEPRDHVIHIIHSQYHNESTRLRSFSVIIFPSNDPLLPIPVLLHLLHLLPLLFQITPKRRPNTHIPQPPPQTPPPLILPPLQRRTSMHLEAENPRTIPLFAFFGHKGRIDLEQDIRERSTEVGAIDVGVPGGFGVVEVFAFGAVEFDGLDVWIIGHAGGEEGGGGAEDARAFAEIGFFVFFELGWMSV